MKKIMQVLLTIVFLVTISCSGPADTQSQLKEIDKLKAKGFPITTEQIADIDKFIAEGKGLIEQGKEKEATESLAKAIDVLNLALDADIFNKAD